MKFLEREIIEKSMYLDIYLLGKLGESQYLFLEVT